MARSWLSRPVLALMIALLALWVAILVPMPAYAGRALSEINEAGELRHSTACLLDVFCFFANHNQAL
jgi:hypothetical protein